MAHNHIADIERGMITKTNVIGIRKLLNAGWRLDNGYDTGTIAPCRVRALRPILTNMLERREPRADATLDASGRKVLTAPRWRKRWNDREREIIKRLSHFTLVRFDDIGRGHFVPVWRAVSNDGFSTFLFRNIPWQAVAYSRDATLENGPTPLAE